MEVHIPQHYLIYFNNKLDMPELTGGCACGRIRYELRLNSFDDARTSLCHCGACKIAMGGAFGLTAKTPIEMFKYMGGCNPKIFVADNGVHREFCDNCGAYIWLSPINSSSYRSACLYISQRIWRAEYEQVSVRMLRWRITE